MAQTKDRYVRVKSKNKAGYTVTKWKDTKTGRIVDSIPLGANVKPTGDELGVSTLSDDIKKSSAQRQKEFIRSHKNRHTLIPDQSLISQAIEREQEYKDQINPIPPELTTPNPALQEGIMFDRRPSDQELRLNEYQIELAQKHAKLDAEGAYTINNLRELFMNSDPSYNRSLNDLAADVSGRFYSTPANKEDATGNEPASNTPAALNNQVAEQDVSDSYQDSGEQDHYQSEVEAREAEKKYKEDQSFLTKSNNAAAKSGVFEDEELLALRDKHRSGEWRNKSNVDTKAGTNIGQLFKSNRRESN